MIYFIRQSKLERVFNKYIDLQKLNRVDLGEHIFYESIYDTGKAIIRYDKGDSYIIVYKAFYEQLLSFFHLNETRMNELLRNWFRRQTKKKVKSILLSDFPHVIKKYHGFPT